MGQSVRCGVKNGQICTIGDPIYIVCPANVVSLQPSRLILPVPLLPGSELFNLITSVLLIRVEYQGRKLNPGQVKTQVTHSFGGLSRQNDGDPNGTYLTAIVGLSTRRHGLLLPENAVNTSV